MKPSPLTPLVLARPLAARGKQPSPPYPHERSGRGPLASTKCSWTSSGAPPLRSSVFFAGGSGRSAYFVSQRPPHSNPEKGKESGPIHYALRCIARSTGYARQRNGSYPAALGGRCPQTPGFATSVSPEKARLHARWASWCCPAVEQESCRCCTPSRLMPDRLGTISGTPQEEQPCPDAPDSVTGIRTGLPSFQAGHP